MHLAETIGNIIQSFPELIANGGYWLLSIIVFLEGLPIIGSFFPGHIAIISAGFLAKFGILNLGMVITVSIITSTLGDVIGFFIGKKMGYSFLQKFSKYVFLKEYHVDKAKKIIDNHTGKAIILGKFSPITRPLIPFLVGASGVHIKTFWFYNILGGALWVTLSVMVGYIFGASYHIGANFLGKFLFIAFIISILIIWGYKFVNIRFHIFKKYEIFILILNLLSLWVLAKTVQDSLSANSFMKNFDIWINILFEKYITPLCSSLAEWISIIGGIEILTFIGFVLGFYFIYKSKWRRGMILLFSIISTNTIVLIMKDIFLRARPENALQILTDPSFPSGHAALSSALLLSLIYIFAPKISSWIRREIAIVGCVLIVFIIGMSRLVLNVHWASDVFAGWALGVFLATSGILLIRYLGSIFIKEKQGI